MALLGKRPKAAESNKPGLKVQKKKAGQTPALAVDGSDDEEDLPDDIDLTKDKKPVRPTKAPKANADAAPVPSEAREDTIASTELPKVAKKPPKKPEAGGAKKQEQQQQLQSTTEAGTKPSFQQLTDTSFSSLPLDSRLLRALHEELQVTHLTEVQEACIPAGLEGQDVVGQARTGTGKTLAYLVPVAQRVLQDCETWNQTKFHTLIFAPTRLLCLQVAGVARKLFKHTKVEVATMTKLNEQSLQLAGASTRPHVLVAMSDRLVKNMRFTSGLADALQGLRVVVFDEVDLILTHTVWVKSKLGALYGLLPPVEQRQTLLFSVSIPTEVNKAVGVMTRPKHVHRWNETHKAALTPLQHVEQTVTICPILQQVGVLLHFLREEQRQHPLDYRILVFFQTMAMVDVMEHVFHSLGMDPIALHEQIPEDLYEKRVQLLGKTRRVICFASDMLSRGADFPDIHCVIQVGAPPSFQQYVHRLGRTGRAGAPGKGILILAEFEGCFTKWFASMKPKPNVISPPTLDHVVQALIHKAQLKVSGGVFGFVDHAKKLYTAQTAYYLAKRKANKVMVKSEKFIAVLNEFVTWLFGLPQPPAMPLLLSKRFRLRHVPGVQRPQRRGVPPTKVHALLEEKRRKGLLLPKAEQRKRQKKIRKGKSTSDEPNAEPTSSPAVPNQ